MLVTVWSNWTRGDASIIVSVIDHGIELDHPDMAANIVAASYDTETGTSPSTIWGSHGTACAGIVGAIDNNTSGVTGVAPDCSLMSVSDRLLLSGTAAMKLADGINWSWQNGADVISNSWGHDGLTSTLIDDAIDSAFTYGRGGLGTVMVFAAGNNNGPLIFPASSNPDIIAVGAIDDCGRRVDPTSGTSCLSWNSFQGSCFGPQLDVVAPGVLIPTTDRQGGAGYAGGDYTLSFGGTSSACPHVAGLAALLLSLNPCLSHDQVEDIIELTAQKTGPYTYSTTVGRPNGTWNNEVGYGLIDIDAAMQMVRELYLQNATITADSVFQVYGSIFAGRDVTPAIPVGDFVIGTGTDVEFRASVQITMDEGFVVESGAEFTAFITDDSDCDDWLTRERNDESEAAFYSPEQDADPSLDLSSISTVVYPNPFDNELTLSFSVPDGAASVGAELYTVYGQRVMSLLDNQTAEPGVQKHVVTVPQDLPSGMYVVQFCIDGDCISEKLFHE